MFCVDKWFILYVGYCKSCKSWKGLFSNHFPCYLNTKLITFYIFTWYSQAFIDSAYDKEYIILRCCKFYILNTGFDYKIILLVTGFL